jgi:hypothetical protein
MSSVRDELDSFHQFAALRLASGDPAPSLDDLFLQWCAQRDKDEINQAVRQGLADVEAGRHQPADQVMESLRKEFGFSSE